MRWLYAARERLSIWIRPAARDRELDDEIVQHLDRETERLAESGLSSGEARRLALDRFGDPGSVVEATRAARGRPLMEGTVQDLKYALRALRQHYGFTVLAVATLALGIGVTTAAFAVVNAVILRPLPYRDADRLVYLREVTASHGFNPPSHPNVVDWRDRATSFDGVASAMFPMAWTVRASGQGDPQRVQALGVSRGFFRTLGVTLDQGREFTDAENALGGAPVVMVSHEFWQNEMGGREPLGTILVNGSTRSVVGVLPAGFEFFTPARVYVPHEQMPGTCRTCRNYMVVARLKPDVTLAQARAEMTALSGAMMKQYFPDTTAADVDVQDLREYLVGDYRARLFVVLGAGMIVLAIACTNLLSAQLARGWAREHEMLVRAALGASRGRLARQLTIESGVLVSAGAALGLALASGLTRVVAAAGADQLPRLAEVSIDARIVAFASAVAIVTALAVGIYPALRISRVNATAALGNSRGSGVAIRESTWRILLGLEVALALALSVGASLLVHTIANIMTADTGFDTRQLLTASITPSERDAAHLEDARAGLAALPGVDGVAYTTRLPLSWGANAGPVRRRTDPAGPTWPAYAGFRLVSSGYFEVLKQPVLQGRPFTAADDERGPMVAIITPGIARTLWPGKDPVGQTIGTNYLWDEWLTVVGVVAEASIWSQPKGAQNEIFVPYRQHLHALNGQGQVVAMVRATAAPATMTEAVRQSLRQSLPDSPALIRPMDDRIEQSAASRRFVMTALTAFAVVALLLAAIGTYGVMWYRVSSRSREIGIRMALGATSGRVQRGVLGGALSIAIGGCAIGMLAAMLSTRFIEALLYGVSRSDAATYVESGGVIVLTVIAGAWLPAWRASRVDPLRTMRVDG